MGYAKLDTLSGGPEVEMWRKFSLFTVNKSTENVFKLLKYRVP